MVAGFDELLQRFAVNGVPQGLQRRGWDILLHRRLSAHQVVNDFFFRQIHLHGGFSIRQFVGLHTLVASCNQFTASRRMFPYFFFRTLFFPLPYQRLLPRQKLRFRSASTTNSSKRPMTMFHVRTNLAAWGSGA